MFGAVEFYNAMKKDGVKLVEEILEGGKEAFERRRRKYGF